MDKIINIAIDGPSGAGKSTISKQIAQRLKYLYIDTGALYRAIGLYALNSSACTTSISEITPLLSKIDLQIKYIDNLQCVFLNGNDVSADIRQNKVSMAASNVSALPPVREFLLELQRNIAKNNCCIMDGRDIGTVILPKAQVKIFLTASPEDRAKRRFEELIMRGQSVIYEAILAEIQQRDYNDSNRKIAPLKPSSESIIVDTTGYSLEKSIDTLYKIIRSKLDVL